MRYEISKSRELILIQIIMFSKYLSTWVIYIRTKGGENGLQEQRLSQ